MAQRSIHTDTEQRKRKFVTKKVDYSKLRTIRIDAKTIIYIRLGQDAETVKRDFIKRVTASSDYSRNLQSERAEAVKRSNVLKQSGF